MHSRNESGKGVNLLKKLSWQQAQLLLNHDSGGKCTVKRSENTS